MLKTQEEIEANYKQHVTDLTGKLAVIKKQVDNWSFVRVILFVAEVISFVSFVKSSGETALYIGSLFLIVPVVLFVLVVRKQSALDKQADYFRQLLWVFNNEINMLHAGENGYNQGAEYQSETHPYTSDLDIFGKASLYALLNRCSTGDGQNNLANIFTAEPEPSALVERQAAIQEITADIDRTFSYRANLRNHDEQRIGQIKHKLKNQLGSELHFTHNKVLRIYLKIVPFLTIILALAGLFVDGVFFKLLVFTGIIHAACTFFNMKHINALYYGFTGSANLLNEYAKAITWTEEKEWQSPYIRQLFGTGERVSLQIKKLSAIIQAFDARLNIVVSTILNLFFLWDLRCCIRLDDWYQTSINGIENGLNRIGHFEELISFATLSYNHPDWVYPQIQNQFALETKAIGHPLIPLHNRIVNDYQVEANPTVDVVTGSNMAGKSTFLRTLGINMILAYSGAPVCAEAMSLSVFKILTYMRIKDSLNESTSTFKAELNRLKMILDGVLKYENAFVLIDEMLRGTNSRDKYLGSKVFIEKLIAERTPALFATHDLQLADLKDSHPQQLRNYHFDIQITGQEMHFDYKLKNGPCKTFNAAILLREIGLAFNEDVS